MAKTNWNTGDIITEDKVNLIETKVEALLNTVNSLVGVVRGLERYMSKIEESEVYGLDDDSKTKNDIGYNSPAPITINPEETDLQSLINNTITGRINTTWPDTATLENADDDIVGIEGGDSLATSVNSLMRYIDRRMNESYETLKINIQTATEEYYSKYVMGDILITTISREKEGEEKGNTLSNEVTHSYWVPFGQGRMLVGAGSDSTNTRSFEVGNTGGEYSHRTNITATAKANKPTVKTTKVTKNTNGTSVVASVTAAAPTITIKNETFDLLPPYIVVYFYKCCDKEEYNTYYEIVEETETNPSSEGTENNTPSEGTSTDSENP